jgi:hypothetical protein
MSLAPLELVSARPAEDGQLRYRGGQQSFRADCRHNRMYSALGPPTAQRRPKHSRWNSHTALAAAGDVLRSTGG